RNGTTAPDPPTTGWRAIRSTRRPRDGTTLIVQRSRTMSSVETRSTDATQTLTRESILGSVGPCTAELFAATKPIFDAHLQLPFVRGLGDGSLEVERFKNWVRQDYLYLKEYSRIFAWGVTKALDLETMGWYAKVLDLTLNVEMGLHRTYAERFGITTEELE